MDNLSQVHTIDNNTYGIELYYNSSSRTLLPPGATRAIIDEINERSEANQIKKYDVIYLTALDNGVKNEGKYVYDGHTFLPLFFDIKYEKYIVPPLFESELDYTIFSQSIGDEILWFDIRDFDKYKLSKINNSELVASYIYEYNINDNCNILFNNNKTLEWITILSQITTHVPIIKLKSNNYILHNCNINDLINNQYIYQTYKIKNATFYNLVCDRLNGESHLDLTNHIRAEYKLDQIDDAPLTIVSNQIYDGESWLNIIDGMYLDYQFSAIFDYDINEFSNYGMWLDTRGIAAQTIQHQIIYDINFTFIYFYYMDVRYRLIIPPDINMILLSKCNRIPVATPKHSIWNRYLNNMNNIDFTNTLVAEPISIDELKDIEFDFGEIDIYMNAYIKSGELNSIYTILKPLILHNSHIVIQYLIEDYI